MSTRVCETESGGAEVDGERRLSLRLRVPRRTIGGDAMVGEKTGDAMVGEKTGAWTGKKKAKVQSAPTSKGVDMTPMTSNEPGPEHGAEQVEGFDWKQVEGSNWTEADVKEAIDFFHCYVGLPDEDVKFWKMLDDQQTEEIQKRLAIAHIRAHKGAELNDAQLLSFLDKDGSFRPYGHQEWCFDSKRCKIAGFQDYQRLILHDYGYQDCYLYNNACSTFESDQQFVRLWEKLLDKTKWLQHYHKLTREECWKMDSVTYYHAAKIRTDLPQIYTRLLGPLLREFRYSVLSDHFHARLYFGIWKRVAKQKMNFKDALDGVTDENMWPFESAVVKAELETDNYKTCVDGIDMNLEEDEAYWLIVEAVRKTVSKPKSYYDYAKKKSDIADKMGLIHSRPHTSST